MLYNSPVVDDGEKIKSTSIYEEDSNNSDNNLKKMKSNRNYCSNSTKKVNKKININNNLNNFKLSSVKNIEHINKRSGFAQKNNKNPLNININMNFNENEKVKDEYKNVRGSYNPFYNDIMKRQRLSSY